MAIVYLDTSESIAFRFRSVFFLIKFPLARKANASYNKGLLANDIIGRIARNRKFTPTDLRHSSLSICSVFAQMDTHLIKEH